MRKKKSHCGTSPNATAPQGRPREGPGQAGKGQDCPFTKVLLAQAAGLAGMGHWGRRTPSSAIHPPGRQGTLPQPLQETQLPPAQDLRPGRGK